jgi:hypothetical protein
MFETNKATSLMSILICRLSEAASLALAICSFLLGPRYTYAIYIMANVLASALLWHMYRSALTP